VLLILLFTWQWTKTNYEIKEQLIEQTRIIAQLQEKLHQSIEEQKVQSIKFEEYEQQQEQRANNEAAQALAIEKLKFDNKKLSQENQQIKKQLEQSQVAYLNLVDEVQKDSELGQSSNQETQEQQEDKAEPKDINNLSGALLPNLPSLSFTPASLMKGRSMPFINSPINQMIKPARSHSNVELGVSYGLLNLQTSTISYVGGKDQDEEDLEPYEEISTTATQVHLAYGINDNWWIKTGARYMGYSTEKEYEFEVEYDASNDRLDDSGKLVSDIKLDVKNELFPAIQTLSIVVNDDPNLSTGDALFGEIYEEQAITLWQFPLAVEYRNDNNKLDWHIGAGGVLTRMQYDAEPIVAFVSTIDKELETKFLEKESQSADIKYLMGIQGNLGLHYQLNKNLMLRGDIMFQYNRYLSGQTYQLGISYQL
jgi:outer membrane protein W